MVIEVVFDILVSKNSRNFIGISCVTTGIYCSEVGKEEYRKILQITNTPGPEMHEGRESKW